MNKLLETTTKYPQTQIWNDSCSVSELKYSINNGSVGATTNPVIVLNVLKKEIKGWEKTIIDLIKNNPNYSEDEIAWEVIKTLGKFGGELLFDEYKNTNGKKGRISFQTNAKFYNNSEKLVKHGVELASVIENSQIKLPTSKAGIKAFEELTYLGICINATVSFSVSQAIAVAEAVERGLERRVSEGLPIENMNPVCTIMAGRVDDYLKSVVKNNELLVEPEILEWAGVSVVKKAYKIYKERKYRTKLLVAAYRNPYHWNQFIGGDIVLTIPYEWQLKFNQSEYEICSTIENEVNTDYLEKLKKIDEFNKAYDEDGLSLDDFEHYGAFKVTMNGFLNGYDELVKIIRSYMIK